MVIGSNTSSLISPIIYQKWKWLDRISTLMGQDGSNNDISVINLYLCACLYKITLFFMMFTSGSAMFETIATKWNDNSTSYSGKIPTKYIFNFFLHICSVCPELKSLMVRNGDFHRSGVGLIPVLVGWVSVALCLQRHNMCK